MRLELPDGQWAELRERLSYRQARDVRRAALAMREDATALADLDMAYVRAHVIAWHVLDTDGDLIPLETPELATDDAIQEIAKWAMEEWGKRADPKGMSVPSPSTLRALG